MNKLLCIALFINTAVFSQERKDLQGLVVSDGNLPVANVFVINKATGTEVKTGATGIFSLPAKAGDALAVYSSGTEVREFAISETSFKEVPYVMAVVYKPYELDEVVVNGQAITAQSLGIVPKGQKQYTPAEKKLYTAGEFKVSDLLKIIAGGMPLDPVFNAINGRTKRMKAGVAIEKKQTAVTYINGLYTEDDIVTGLKVPREKVSGFVYYAIENSEIAAAAKADNEPLVRLLMIDVAGKYLKLQE